MKNARNFNKMKIMLFASIIILIISINYTNSQTITDPHKIKTLDDTDIYDTFNHSLPQFNITKSMLPIFSDPGRMDITISAKMIFDNQVTQTPKNNYRFKNNEKDAIAKHIKKLEILISYTDTTLPISIDWIRIESKVAQDVYRGVYDSVLTAVVQSTISHFTSNSFQSRGIRLFRFYLRDEHLPMHWSPLYAKINWQYRTE